jgi:hypothetical protein
LDFADVNISTFRPITGYEAWGEIMVNARGGPLLLAGETDRGQVAVLSFALQDSDLPLQLAYPILIANLVQWYTPPRAVNVPSSVAPGSAVPMRPIDGDSIHVTLPDGDTTDLPLGETSAQVVFADTAATGIYRLDVKRGDENLGTEYFAVNLFDAFESDITPRDSVTIGTTEISESEREERGQHELWQYLVLLGLAILLIEWLYFHRANLRQMFTQVRGRREQPYRNI